MKHRDTFWTYVKKSVFSFGASVIVLALLAIATGEEAKEISPLFDFGANAVPVPVLFELLGLSFLFAMERFLFFTDAVIKNMGLVLRTACMAASTILTAVAFILIFEWFPKNDLLSWMCFGISFLTCFILSLIITYFREKRENEKMALALEKIKKE